MAPLIGGHVSVAGGLEKAVDRAVAQEFDLMQIFVSSPRSFNITQYTDEQIEAFRTKYVKSNLQGIYFHAIYLINLGSANVTLRKLSIESLIHYLQMGEKLGAYGTIVHVGNNDLDAITKGIIQILSETPTSQHLLIENMASEKRAVFRVEDCVEILEKVNSDRVKLCVDTQHLFASGVDIRRREKATVWLNTVEKEIGVDKIACIHVNDSKTACSSQHDRHENIGQGEIGTAGIKSFFSDKRLNEIPIILETPGFDGKGPDKRNREILLSILDQT